MTPTFRITLFTGLLAALAATTAPLLAQETPAAPPAAAQAPDARPGWPQAVLSKFDTDGDGKVTLEEIRAQKLREAAALDANGDGKISADEMIAAEMARVQPMVEARAKSRIAALDLDGDGQLSAAELAVAPGAGAGGFGSERVFGRLDANGDGILGADELAARKGPRMAFGGTGDGAGRGDWGKGRDAARHGDRPDHGEHRGMRHGDRKNGPAGDAPARGPADAPPADTAVN